MNDIAIRLDDEPLTLPASTSLAALVTQRGLAPQDVATAVNGDFVPRSAREQRLLAAGDQVLFFQPIPGG